MGSYIPNTDRDRKTMLKALGRKSVDELFADVPKKARLTDLALPSGMSELEVSKQIGALAAKNTVFRTVFRGAGAYRHYIPAAVKRITANETFVTAYTPYQAEISQGILQSIFEYQTMICELTGMDVSNASVYDGASAASEAINMCRERDRSTCYISGAAHPQVIETVKTYCAGYGIKVVVVPVADGRLDASALEKLLAADKNAACVYVQQPNYFGLIENAVSIGEIAHKAGAQYIIGCNPISLGTLMSPGECGADIAVGEGQPLGMPLAFGGPYLGFMACKSHLMRKLPGRIVGETTDKAPAGSQEAGNRAFVLTLQAREQHIRREKASSNVCSNEALCALTAAVYLSVMGQEGFQDAARQCHSKAVYAAKQITGVPGYSLLYKGDFFHEFVTECPDSGKALAALETKGILGGLPLSRTGILWAVTELNTKEEIDEVAEILRGVGKKEFYT